MGGVLSPVTSVLTVASVERIIRYNATERYPMIRWLLAWFDIAERRCGSCGELLGWARHMRPRGMVSRGLCSHCTESLFS